MITSTIFTEYSGDTSAKYQLSATMTSKVGQIEIELLQLAKSGNCILIVVGVLVNAELPVFRPTHLFDRIEVWISYLQHVFHNNAPNKSLYGFQGSLAECGDPMRCVSRPAFSERMNGDLSHPMHVSRTDFSSSVYNNFVGHYGYDTLLDGEIFYHTCQESPDLLGGILKKLPIKAEILLIEFCSHFIYTFNIYTFEKTNECRLNMQIEYFESVRIENCILIAGGIAIDDATYDEQVIDSIHLFDIQNNQMQMDFEYLPYPLTAFQLCFHDNTLYVLGGSMTRGGIPLGNVYKSDVARRINWTLCSPMPIPLRDFSAVVYNDFIYVFGGRCTSNMRSNVPYLQECFKYNIAYDEWSPISSMIRGRTNSAVTIYLDEIYLVGGYLDYVNSESEFGCTETLIYNPQNDSWRYGPWINELRAYSSLLNINGELWVIGGIEDTLSYEIYRDGAFHQFYNDRLRGFVGSSYFL